MAIPIAIASCRRAPPPLSPDVAYQEARAKFQHGDLSGAFFDAGRAAEQINPTDPVGAWRFRVLQGEAQVWQGLSREALRLLAPEPPHGVAADVVARRLLLRAQASTSLQQFDDAERFLTEASRMADAGVPEIAAEVALAFGTRHYRLNELDDAEADMQRALRIARERQQPFVEAMARGSLGLVRMRRHQYGDANDWFQSAITIASGIQARGVLEKLSGNLGWAYQAMGELERALDLFSEMDAQAQRIGAVKDRQIWLANIAEIQLSRRDFDAAETTHRKALEIARQIEDKEQIALNLHGLAMIMLDRDRLQEAETLNNEALELERAIAREFVPYALVTRAEIAVKRHDRAAAEALLTGVIRDTTANLTLRATAQSVLADLHAAQPENAARANKEYREAILTIEQGREVLGREDHKMPFATNAKPIYDAYVGFLMSRGDVAAACGVAEMSRAQTLTQGLGMRGSFSAADLQAADRGCQVLQNRDPSSGVVLAYWVAPKRSYLWVLTPTDVKGVTLPGEETLNELVTRYRKALAGPFDARASSNAAGLELFAKLVEPAKAWIGDRATVTIIPHGTLCSLNFETLLVPTPAPHYWIEDVSIANASAMAMLGAAGGGDRPRARASKTLLLIGNPQSPDNRYPPLEHAVTEMTAIAAHFPPADQTQFSGAAATPAAYGRAKPGNYDLIHFVAHGTASRPSPLDSAIVLSEDGTSHNLYARDIALTPLDARLVTISACDSAGTRTYSGEGLVGLSWAFLRAGAQEVIAALWEVNDASTAQLMDRLYAGIAAGASPADALRAAKLAMLKSDTIYRRPFYWAPFVIYSGGRAVTAAQPRGPRAS